MAARAASWTCRKCKAKHANRRLRKCPACGTTRPARRKPAHMKALDLPYEHYVELNGGDFCWIGRHAGLPCGRDRPATSRRLNRDHCHKTGTPRGLLCGGHMGCNKRLGRVDDVKWLEAAAAYLRRSEL